MSDFKLQIHQKPPTSIETCDKEQIHIPGTVQSFGCLIAFDAKFEITRASRNVESMLEIPVESLIGLPLENVLGKEQIKEIATALEDNQQTKISLKLNSSKSVSAFVRSAGEESYLNLMQDISQLDAFDSIRRFVSALATTNTQLEAAQIFATEIRRISRFDRVKIYRFDKDWNGEVIAESKKADVASYLGLFFPESDIPKQARELYVRNRVRVIGDINDPQSEIIEKAGLQPLDLSFSFIRSVSPIHLQYLRNIEVHSSMSISLFENGKFWGLVACHHYSPRNFDCIEEVVYQTISELCSNRLSMLKAQNDGMQQLRTMSFIQPLIAELDTKGALEALLSAKKSLSDLIKANGVAIVLNKEIYKTGTVPSDGKLQSLVQWLERGAEQVFECDDLPSRFGEDIGPMACGLLAIKVPAATNLWIMWFRAAITKEVKWAGDPYTPKTSTPFGERLFPRTSFELWKETKEGRSAPWGEEDLDSAMLVAKFLSGSKTVGSLDAP